MMEAVGLIPSDTKKPGGKKVGQMVSHYIKPHGLFDKVCRQLLNEGLNISWGDRFGGKVKKQKNGRIKYTCPTCELRAWAKPAVSLLCGECQEILNPQN